MTPSGTTPALRHPRELPPRDEWLAQLTTLPPEQHAARLQEMVAETKAAGGCGHLHTHDGLPCRRSPKAGYPVCPGHGARVPATVTKAERLLAFARMPAIEGILLELEQAEQDECPTCHYPKQSLKERKHLAALRFKLLDRTGFGPRSSIDLTAKAEQPAFDVAVLTPEELAELDALLANMERLKAKIANRQARAAVSMAMPALLPPAEDQEPAAVVEGQVVPEGK